MALASEVIADRWTVLLVRELLDSPARFTDLHEALPGLSRTMLSARLRRLVASNLIERAGPPTEVSAGYRLTPAGAALRPILAAMGGWATAWVGPQRSNSDVVDLLQRMETALNTRPAALGKIGIEFRFQGGTDQNGWLQVSSKGSSRAWTTGPAADDIDVVVTATVAVLESLGSGGLTCRAALGEGQVQIAGTRRATEMFHQLFKPGMFAPSDRRRSSGVSAVASGAQ